MATTKETVVLDFQIEQGDAISELEKTKKVILGLKQEQKELNDAYKKGNITLDEYASDSVRLEGVLKKQQSTYNNVQKSVTGVKTQLDKLIDSNKVISKEFQNTSKTLDKTSSSLSDAAGKFGEAAKSTEVAGVSVDSLTTKFASMAGPQGVIAGVVAGLAGLFKLYTSSAAGARDLESAQDQLSQSFTTIGNDLAKIVGADGKGGGLLSALAFQLNQRFFGSGAAVSGLIASQAKQSLKELELLELDSKRVAKSALDQAEKLRQIRDNSDKSNNERLDAARKVQGYIDVRELAQLNVQKQKLDKLKELQKLNQDDLELQKAIKNVEFETADIREDSQGQRTEALNGILSLQREIAAQSEIDRVNALESEVESRNIDVENLQDISAQKIQISSTLADAQIDINKKMNSVTAENNKKSAVLFATVEQQKLATAQAVLNGIASLQSDFGIKSKALASGLAIANTFLGVTEILKAPTAPFIEPFASVVRAATIATTIASGLAAVAKINGVGFSEGGYTGPGTKYQPAGVVHAGEVVWNQRDVAAAGGPAAANALRPTSGYAEGGIVAKGMTSGIQSQSAIKNAPKYSLSIKEFNEFNSQLDQKIKFTEL